MASRRTRAALALVVVAALIALALGARSLWSTAKSHFTADNCTVGGYDLDPDQASVGAAMVGAVTQYRRPLPSRATVLVLMAGLQESKLRNLAPGDGDRDSVGVLQQRPSQGWGNGHAAVLNDVGEATKEFLDALVKVPRWQRLPLAQAIQDVQISADGSAYAQHETEARALSAALRGLRAEAITCTFDAPSVVAKPARVAQLATDELGIDTPEPLGNTVRVPGAGRQTEAWFVANADRLGIEQVSYDRRQWTRTAGWAGSATSAALVIATMYRAESS